MMNEKTRSVARGGMLAALAIAAAAIEGLVPPLPFMPPGAKLGIPNVISMYTAKKCGIAAALAVTVIKSLFVLLSRGVTAFLMSVFAGIVSTLVTSLLLRREQGRLGCVGIGVVGALLHNFTQLCVATLLAGSAVMYYLPVMAVAACISGSLTGILLHLLLSYQRQ